MAKNNKQIIVKTLRRIDFLEVGKDRFDFHTSKFLDQVGQENIISIIPINYEHVDIATQKVVNDFGIIVVYSSDTKI